MHLVYFALVASSLSSRAMTIHGTANDGSKLSRYDVGWGHHAAVYDAAASSSREQSCNAGSCQHPLRHQTPLILAYVQPHGLLKISPVQTGRGQKDQSAPLLARILPVPVLKLGCTTDMQPPGPPTLEKTAQACWHGGRTAHSPLPQA